MAIDELPQTEETLWIRILGRAKTQRQAILELLGLPEEDARRSSVLQLLVGWKVTIEGSGAINNEEQALMATLSQAYLEWERQTEARGMQQGAEREARSLVLRLLNRRIGALPESVRSRINALSLHQLESLGEALLDFASLSDLEAWLVEQGQ